MKHEACFIVAWLVKISGTRQPARVLCSPRVLKKINLSPWTGYTLLFFCQIFAHNKNQSTSLGVVRDFLRYFWLACQCQTQRNYSWIKRVLFLGRMPLIADQWLRVTPICGLISARSGFYGTDEGQFISKTKWLTFLDQYHFDDGPI